MAAARASLACLVAALVLASGAVAPAGAQEDPEAARKRLERVRQELKDVAAERRQVEGRRSAAARELRAADEEVARAARGLRELQQQIAAAEGELQALQERRTGMQAALAGRREELASLLRSAYARGRAAPLKLLLAQDSVAEANRMLAYHGYLQREQVARIRGLAAELEELSRLEQEIAGRRDALESARADLGERLAGLEAERAKRQSLVADLDARFEDRQSREKALGRDAKALEDLLARLREAAAKAEAERRAAAAREAARQEAGPGKPPAPRPAVPSGPSVGGAGWPVDGRLLAGFGATMPDGRKSQGLLVAAPAGTTVRAAAAGTVVYAEWMSGFGLILIIDHGDGHMSLYAHSETLLRGAGDTVAAGDPVATVGSSGGHGQPALYFELRRGGKPVDPRPWLGR